MTFAEPIIRIKDFNTAELKIARGKAGMVVCQDDNACDVAVEILEQGGNAADAGVALAYALAVTQPKAGNLGGGGFALYYDAKTEKVHAID